MNSPIAAFFQGMAQIAPAKRKDGCKGYQHYEGDFDCGYNTTLACDDCKYGAAGGRKDPQAKCNQPPKG